MEMNAVDARLSIKVKRDSVFPPAHFATKLARSDIVKAEALTSHSPCHNRTHIDPLWMNRDKAAKENSVGVQNKVTMPLL